MIFSSALGFPGVVSPLHRQAVWGKSICSGPRRQVVAGDGSCPARIGSHISRRGSPTQIYSPLYVSRFLTGGCSTESRVDEVGIANVSSNRQTKSNAGREVVRTLNSNGAKSAAFVSRDGDADLEPLLPSVEVNAQQDKDNEKENENQFRTMEEIVAAVPPKQSKITEEEALSKVDPSLPTMRDIVARAAQEGINLEVKSFGPTFQIIVTSPDETIVFGKADGWIKWWWRKGKILHLESVILDRGVSKKVGNVFGAGFFVGAATLRYGLDQGCRTAELLAIYDDESTHSKLVKYYTRLGFETLYEVNEEEMKYLPDRVVWGGVGTRMDADCEELLRKWCPVLKPKAKSRSRSKGGFSRGAPVVTRAEHSYALNTGALMPAVALGTAAFGLSPEETKQYVLKALEIGYRSVDTAKLYNTEASVGEALQEAFNAGLLKREEVFVTTKIWCDDMDPPSIIPAMKRSLSELKLDYVDLILVHWPMRIRQGSNIFTLQEGDWMPLDLVGCWKQLEKGVELGLAKALGVSNFSTTRLQEIEPHAKIVPAVNQMEMHPGCEIPKIRAYCNEKGIHVTAWSALGAPGYGGKWGTNAVLDSPILKEIAEKHGKTAAQVALRWGLEKGVGLTVKSSNPERLAQNLDLFDWTLSPEDNAKIKEIAPFRIFDGSIYFKVANSPFKSLADLWDDY